MKFLKTGPIDQQGRLLFDPELRFVPSGKAVSQFQFEALDGSVIQCEAWESLAESMAEDGRRQMGITIHGEWRTRNWTDREDKNHTLNYVLVKQYEWE